MTPDLLTQTYILTACRRKQLRLYTVNMPMSVSHRTFSGQFRHQSGQFSLCPTKLILAAIQVEILHFQQFTTSTDSTQSVNTMQRLLTESFRVSLHCSGKTLKTPSKVFSFLEIRLWLCLLVFLPFKNLTNLSLTTKQLPSFSLSLTSQVTLLSNFASAHAQFNISNCALLRNTFE